MVYSSHSLFGKEMFFAIFVIQKKFDKKIRQYPTLLLTKVEPGIFLSWQYKEQDSLVKQLKQVSKNIGEQGRLQSLIKSFIGQLTQW